MDGRSEPPVSRTHPAVFVDLPNWIGDVVMSLPAVARLGDRWRPGEMVLGCRPPVARLLGLVFPGSNVIATDRRTSLLATARRLTVGHGRFHTAVTLRHATRAKLLVRLVARRTLGSAGGGGGILLTQAFPVDRDRHQVHDADPVLRALDLPPADPAWRPPLPSVLATEGKAALERAGVTGKIAGLVPGAAWGDSKRWPVESFGRLARLIGEIGLTPVVFIGPGEEWLAAEISEAAGRRVANVGPDLDVAGLFGALAGARVVISNDSGPMHLAALAGVPIVALFGPTDPRRTAPLVEPRRVLCRAMDCSPCFKARCPLGHQRCLKEITPEAVAAEAQRLAGM